MNIAIIKFSKAAQEYVKYSHESQRVVVVVDPDTANLVFCEFICPEADKSFDLSEAIQRKDVDTVMITIPDMANGISLTALAYGKSVMTNIPLDPRLSQLGLKIMEMA